MSYSQSSLHRIQNYPILVFLVLKNLFSKPRPPASLTNEDKSAPEKFPHLGSLEIAFKSTFRVRDYCWCVLMFSNFQSLLRVGNSMYKVLSSLPGLSIAGSIISGLLVAPMTNTPFYHSNHLILSIKY